MLRIYNVMLEEIREMKPLIDEIAKYDADLARQMRKASVNSLLNLAEGTDAIGGNKRLRYSTSVSEWNETLAGFDAAEVLDYVRVPAVRRDRWQMIRATLLNLVRPKRRR